LKNASHFRHAGLAVAVIPDQRRSLIQTVRLLSSQIVNQNLVGKPFNQESFFPGKGEMLRFGHTFLSTAPAIVNAVTPSRRWATSRI
jgi:hypothetical protein